MSVKIEPFQASDLEYVAQVRQPYGDILESLIEEPISEVENEYAWTAWTETGKAVACCGIVTGEAWALIDPGLSPSVAMTVTRRVRRELINHTRQIGPVRAIIRDGVPEARRWAEALGFKLTDYPNDIGTIWVFDRANFL